MAYPTSTIAFTTKNTGDIIQAGDVNLPQTEIVSIETGLLSGFQHIIFPLTDATYDAGKPTLRYKNFYSDALQALDVASRSNYVTVTAAITGAGPTISTSGASDATINLLIGTKGGTQLKFIDVASLVNFLQYAGTATGSDPTLSVQGDANRGLILAPQGTGSFQIGSTSIFKVDGANQGRLATGNANRTRMFQSMAYTALTPGQVITTGAGQAISWTSAPVNTDSMWSSGAATRLTAQVAGKHLIIAGIDWAGSGLAVANMGSVVRKNGTATILNLVANSGQQLLEIGSQIVSLAATDYIELMGTQNSGSSKTTSTGVTMTLQMIYLGE